MEIEEIPMYEENFLEKIKLSDLKDKPIKAKVVATKVGLTKFKKPFVHIETEDGLRYGLILASSIVGRLQKQYGRLLENMPDKIFTWKAIDTGRQFNGYHVYNLEME